MISVRNATIVLMCTLGAGCFLDESPLAGSKTGAGSVMSEPGTSSTRPGFKPRDPGVTTGSPTEMDAAAADASVDASMPEHDAGATHAPSKPKDAGHPQMSDARVAQMGMDAAAAPAKPDASAPPPADAQVIVDAGTPHMPDAQVAVDAATPMLPTPIHRYEFTGSGRVATDSIGHADGELRSGSFLDGAGSVTSTTRSNDVGVDLPVGLLADLTGFTIVGWMDVRSDDCWQRLFDFTYFAQRGMGNGNGEIQASALFVTPFGCPDGIPTAAYVTEQMQYRVESPRKLLRPRNLMLGLMYDSTTRMLQLIVDGAVQREARVPINLRELARARGGLGRSYHPDDTPLNGSISELRIYSQTLDAATLSELAKRGPDQL